MASKKFYHDIDLLNVGQLVGVRTQNVTTSQRNDLSSVLGENNQGLPVWDTDEKMGYTWDGSEFVKNATAIEGDVVFKGLFDASVPLDSELQPQPIEAKSGHQYIVSADGTFDAGDSGITVEGEKVLEKGDKILFISETEAYVFQTNVDSADEVKAGLIRIATEQETLDGENDSAAVTPATLEAKLVGVPRTHNDVVNVTALSPVTINHNLNLEDKDNFVFYAVLNGSAVSVDVDSIDSNSLTVTSLVDLDDLHVTIIGK